MSPSSFALRLISLIALLALPSPAQAQLNGGFLAGAARIDITPQNPVRMSGYASRKELSTGVHDPLSARVLAFEIDGKRLIMVSTDLIATHATCLGPGNTLISGDVLGLAQQLVERVLGSHVIAPAFAGASGDIDPWFRVLPSFNTEPGWIPEPVLLGTLLGQEVAHACRGITKTSPADRIATAFVTLQLPAKPHEAAATGTTDTVSFNVTAARLGEVAWIGLGGEVLTEIGLAIKAASPCRHTFVITHCNGAAGYLATKEAHAQQGYEVRTSPFAPQAADLVIRESIRLLHTL